MISFFYENWRQKINQMGTKTDLQTHPNGPISGDEMWHQQRIHFASWRPGAASAGRHHPLWRLWVPSQWRILWSNLRTSFFSCASNFCKHLTSHQNYRCHFSSFFHKKIEWNTIPKVLIHKILNIDPFWLKLHGSTQLCELSRSVKFQRDWRLLRVTRTNYFHPNRTLFSKNGGSGGCPPGGTVANFLDFCWGFF